jgi:ribosomal protein S18 acetylase RimI-like enzyme
MPDYSLRASTSADAAFLYALAELTMRHHLDVLGKRWSMAKMQAKCENDAVDPDQQIIQVGGRDGGALSVQTRADELYLHALLLLPEFQRVGIGSILLTQTLERAQALNLPVRLNVLTSNPARSFYEKFGFTVCAEQDLHYAMQFSPLPVT